MEKHDDMRTTFEAVIVANGDYPTHPLPLQVLEAAPFVVCCDGGADAYIREGHVPDLIVGDGDSLSEANRQRYAHLMLHVSEQETNDLSKAVRHLQALGKRRIAILGATGKREDHTLGNISLLLEYMRSGMEVCMFTGHGLFLPCRDTQTIACQPGQQISIFNFTACNLHSEGLRYPIYDFTNWWQGTLNETTSDHFTIHASGEYLLFLNYV